MGKLFFYILKYGANILKYFTFCEPKGFFPVIVSKFEPKMLAVQNLSKTFLGFFRWKNVFRR